MKLDRIKNAITAARTFVAGVLTQFDRKDIAPALLMIGIVSVAYGASRFHEGLGFLTFGLLVLLSVRPVKGWFE